MESNIEKIKLYLTPALKDVDEKVLAKVGVAAFGSMLSYLESEEPGVVEDFLSWTGATKNDIVDRKILRYIVSYVEAFDRKDSPVVKTASGLSFNVPTPAEKVTVSEILEKIESLSY